MSSWGRWGEEDERGALNLITPDVVARGLATVRSGVPLSLGLELRSGHGPVAGMRQPPQHFMTRDGGDYAAGLQERPGYGYADDYLIVGCHGTTHLDALSHVWTERTMWNGFSADTVTSRGAARCGVEKAGPIVTRGWLVDLVPEGALGLDDGHPISVQVLRAAAEDQGVAPEPGDALLVRTGWLARWRDGTAAIDCWPGLAGDCEPWIVERGITVVGADNLAVEVEPSGDPTHGAPLHVGLLRDHGIHLLELLDLEQLAASGRHDFLLVIAPLRIVGGVGSPVAPVAVL